MLVKSDCAAQRFGIIDDRTVACRNALGNTGRTGGKDDINGVDVQLLGANLTVEADQVFHSEEEQCRYAYFACNSDRATYILCFYLRGGAQIEDVEFQLLALRHASGTAEALARLDDHAKRQAVALMAAAELVMHHFGLDEFVPEIIGGTDDTRNTKGKVIAWALREYGVDPKTAVMVGDREHDIHGAAENGIPAIGVTWGYGDRAELENAGAKAVFDTAEEVVNYIIRG